jgi:hypothetical protein
MRMVIDQHGIRRLVLPFNTLVQDMMADRAALLLSHKPSGHFK